MDVDAKATTYELLQALLAALLFFVHIVLVPVVLIGGVYIGLGVGLLELLVAWRMSTRLTLRATDAPTSIRAALGGLRPWLLGMGIFITLFSLGYTALIVISMRT